jgi:DNA-binding response OmpR family regulator
MTVTSTAPAVGLPITARGGSAVVVVGSGRLPPGTTELAGSTIRLGRGQSEVLDRMPVPFAVLAAPAQSQADPVALVAELRARTCAPLIAVLDGAGERQRIAVLEAGADDCVDATLGIGELAARVAAVARRPGMGCLRVAGGVSVDPTTREVRVDGRAVELTRREFDVLSALVGVPRRVVSHDELLREVWGERHPDAIPHATVIEHVRRVRSKLRAAGAAEGCIATVRGVGYRFDPSRCSAHPRATP